MRPQAPTRSAAPTAADHGAATPWVPTGRTVVPLAAAAVFIVGQLYVVIPLLGEFASAWGASTSRTAWMVTAFGFAYATGLLFSGPAADRFGRRRVLLAGLVAASIATAAVGFADGLAAGLVLRVVQGFTSAFFTPAALAYVAERIAPPRRAIAITAMTSGFIGSAIIAQAAATVLLPAFGWESPFFGGAVGVLALAAILAFVLEPDPERQGAKRVDPVRAMRALLSRRDTLLLYLATATVLSSFVAVYTGLETVGPAGLSGDPAAMLVLRASALPAFIAAPWIAGRLRRFPPTTRVVGALATAAAGALLTAAASGFGTWAIALSLFVFVGGIALSAPGLIEAVGEVAGEARAAATALYTFVLFLGASLGPQLAAAADGAGFIGVCAAAGALLAAGMLTALAARRIRRRPA
jgi:predicted MFS family arabinose efflux permease